MNAGRTQTFNLSAQKEPKHTCRRWKRAGLQSLAFGGSSPSVCSTFPGDTSVTRKFAIFVATTGQSRQIVANRGKNCYIWFTGRTLEFTAQFYISDVKHFYRFRKRYLPGGSRGQPHGLRKGARLRNREMYPFDWGLRDILTFGTPGDP